MPAFAFPLVTPTTVSSLRESPACLATSHAKPARIPPMPTVLHALMAQNYKPVHALLFLPNVTSLTALSSSTMNVFLVTQPAKLAMTSAIKTVPHVSILKFSKVDHA